MNKICFTGFLCIALLLMGCKQSSDDDKKAKSIPADTIASQKKGKDIKAGDTIVILANNVNMRTQDKVGDNVILQLDSGAIATYLKRGRKERIGDMIDYWYKIDYNERKMWVFGALTSARSEDLSIDENQEAKLNKNQVKGKFVPNEEDTDYFIIEDAEGQRREYLIYGGYEGQQMFQDNSDDMEGLEVLVTWDKQNLFIESEQKNKEVLRILKVELAD
ncbi:MAG: hypothetical protein ACQESZ_00545 [Bacteroidota bacterium]